MKKTSILLYFILWFGIVFAVAPLIINEGIRNKEREANGIYGYNKVDVYLKDRYGILSAFTLRDMEKLQRELDNPIISYSSVDDSVVSANERILNPVRITGTDFRYGCFHHLNMVKGSYFTERADKNKERVAIINTDMAWLLFNSVDVLDHKLKIYNEDFTIIGLSGKRGRADRSGNVKEDILEKKIHMHPYQVYIPASVLFDHQGNESIYALSIYTEQSNTKNKEIERALRHIGKESDRYMITDYHEQNWLLSQKNRIFRMLISLGLVLLFILGMIHLLKDIIGRIRASGRSAYLLQSVRENSKAVTVALVKVVIMIGVVFVIGKLAVFNLYIPREHIPERLIDTDFYSDVSVADTRDYNLSLKSMDLNPNFFRMDISQKITTNLTMIGMIAGYLLSVMIVPILVRHIKLMNLFIMIPTMTIAACFVMGIYSTYTLSLPPGGDLISVALFMMHMMVLAGFVHTKRGYERRERDAEGNL